MKTIVVLALSVFFSGLAHASYNTDEPGKTVQCKGSQTKVIINKARTEITVIDEIDPGHPAIYLVGDDGRQTDGDTFVSYTGVEVSSKAVVTLSLDDQGDKLVSDNDMRTALKLKCRKSH